MPKQKLRGLLTAAVVLIIACGSGTSCRSPDRSVSARTAAVIITNQSAEEIKRAASAVFHEHGFEKANGEPGELVFQKPGSFSNAMLHGDWVKGNVWVRVKLYQRELSPVQRVLDADIYMVQDHDDPLFQSERKVSARKGEIQNLLDEVASRLKQ